MIGRFHILITPLLLVAFLPEVSAAPFVPTRIAQCVALSADGRFAATGKSGQSNSEFPPRPHPSPRKTGVVHVWDIVSGKIVARMETYGDITKVAFSPDAKLVAASRMFSTIDGIPMNEVRVWDIATRKTVLALDRCHSFDFSPDGTEMLVASRTRCAIYNIAEGKRLRHLSDLGGAVTVAYMGDGGQILGAIHNDGQYSMRVVDAKTGATQRESLQLQDSFYRVAQSADGKMLATGHARNLILLWDAEQLQPVAKFQVRGDTSLQHPFFSPDGSLLGVGNQSNGDAAFFDINSHKEVFRYTFARGTFRTHYSRSQTETHRPEKDPHRFVFSADGNFFIAGCHGGIVRVVNTGQEIQRFEE
ncbi:MAG: WD40 repeat protein [Pirellulaceae bacterium]|jgi:WD40 repeat protein